MKSRKDFICENINSWCWGNWWFFWSPLDKVRSKRIFFSERKKERKILINNKKNKSDFRLLPTYENTKIFYNWISKNQIQKPNFFDACRIHLIIDKIILSSKTNKKIYID